MRRFPLVLLFAVAVVILAKSAAADSQKQPNYFPLAEGSKWEYKVDAPGAGPETIVVQAVKKEVAGKVTMYLMETTKQGKTEGSEHLSSDETGIYRHKLNNQALPKPVCLLKYPVVVGDTWKDEQEVMGLKMTMTGKVDKEEEIQVPAGKYKTIPVHVDAEIAGTKMTTTYWFAADVGIVKQVAEVGGVKVTLELKPKDEKKDDKKDDKKGG